MPGEKSLESNKLNEIQKGLTQESQLERDARRINIKNKQKAEDLKLTNPRKELKFITEQDRLNIQSEMENMREKFDSMQRQEQLLKTKVVYEK